MLQDNEKLLSENASLKLQLETIDPSSECSMLKNEIVKEERQEVNNRVATTPPRDDGDVAAAVKNRVHISPIVFSDTPSSTCQSNKSIKGTNYRCRFCFKMFKLKSHLFDHLASKHNWKA